MKALSVRLHMVDSLYLVLPLSLRCTSTWGVIGACIYFAGFALPVQGNLPLLGLALCSTLAVVASSGTRMPGWTPLTFMVVVFLSVTAVSTVGSIDSGRSLRLSTPLIPAGLLFLSITAYCAGSRDIRRLYLTLSVVGLGLAALVLGEAWAAAGRISVRALVSQLGIPILIVPNDITILAVIAPLSLVLLGHKPYSWGTLVPAFSLLLSVGAVRAYQSRTALVTMLLALVCATVLSPRSHRQMHWRIVGLVVVLLGLLTWLDVPHVPDPSLQTKFHERGLSGRVPLWDIAWTMFLDAPWLGQGPHTFGLFSTKAPWAHNLYLEALAEQGLCGFAALSGLLACGLVGGWTLRRAPMENVRLLGAGALAGLMGLCVAGEIELTLLREWVVTLLFTLLGVIGYLVSTHLLHGAIRLEERSGTETAVMNGALA